MEQGHESKRVAASGAAPPTHGLRPSSPIGGGDPNPAAGACPIANESSMLGGKRLTHAFYRRDSREVAPELLNKLLVHGSLVGRIVEVEAYAGAEDPGSHAFRGMTRRNRTMFGPPGRLYVYFTYGMHWCANAVCGDEGNGLAVLLRALAPISGVDEMWRSRTSGRSGARRERDLCSGPAKLCQAFGISGDHDGADLTGGASISIVDDGVVPPSTPGNSTRIGLRDGAELPWRWYVSGDPNLSRPDRSGVAGASRRPGSGARSGRDQTMSPGG